MYFIRLTCIFVGCLLAVNTVFAEDFSDVPKGHYAYEAIGYLRERKILLGYADGTFRPDQRVNRAEALKIIVSPWLQTRHWLSSPVHSTPMYRAEPGSRRM